MARVPHPVDEPPVDASRIAASRADAARGGVGPLVWLATGLPFVVAVSRVASSAQWRDDVAVVRDLGLSPVGLGGGLSTALTQLLSLLPLGPVGFRAALVGALAMLVATRALFVITLEGLRALERPDRPSRRLTPVLATVGTLVAGLSPAWQSEATVAGGGLPALALALVIVAIAVRLVSETADDLSTMAWSPGRLVVAAGAVLGALVAESPFTAVVTAASVVSLFAVRWLLRGSKGRVLAPRRSLAWALAAAAVAALTLMAPALVRPWSPLALVDLGHSFSASAVLPVDLAASRTTALRAWMNELGIVALGTAAAGLAGAGARRSGRWLAACFVLVLIVDVLFPARGAARFTTDPCAPMRMLAIAVLCGLSAMGVRSLVSVLERMRVPLAQPAAALLVMFHVTLVALTAEESKRVADRSERDGAEDWADLALGRLEPGSVLVLYDPSLVYRAWSARIARGERPDLVVVPVPMLGRGRLASDLVSRERAVEPVIRSFALTGQPGEFELSRLADARPVHVEYQSGWNKRLTQHLTVDGLWLEYAPQPLGASDRLEMTRAAPEPLLETLALTSPDREYDAATSRAVAAALRRQARVLLQLGDRPTAGEFLERSASLVPEQPVTEPASSGVAMAGLDLRFAAIQAKSRAASP